MLVITGDGPRPDVPGDEAREPAFGMKAMWVSEMFAANVKREGFKPVDNMSVLLTHLREVIRNNLAQLLSYKDMRALLDRLEPEYRRLIDEIMPSQISYSGIQAVLKLLLAERISIRNLHLILEAIAEIAPHVRRAEQLAEHVRMRLAQQICGDLADGGVLKVLRLGNRWDLAFHQSLKRDAKGDVVEFDIDPRLIEQFGTEASKVIRGCMDQGHQFVLVAAPDARPYVRMVTERLFADAARALACRDRARRADQVARHDLVTADRPGHGPAGVPAVLPHRRLPDADAGVLQPARAGAGAPVHRRRRDAGAGAAAACRCCAPRCRNCRPSRGARCSISETVDRRPDRRHGARCSSWRCSSWRRRRPCTSASAACRARPSRTPSRCRPSPR